MIELAQELWEVDVDWRCITTNGSIKKNGKAVMGKGCAKEAADRYPEIPRAFAALLREYGNKVQFIRGAEDTEKAILAFPTKREWYLPSDLGLIELSCQQLRRLFDSVVAASSGKWIPRIAIPRPGCTHGQLSWEQVKPILERYFPEDNFIVVSKDML